MSNVYGELHDTFNKLRGNYIRDKKVGEYFSGMKTMINSMHLRLKEIEGDENENKHHLSVIKLMYLNQYSYDAAKMRDKYAQAFIQCGLKYNFPTSTKIALQEDILNFRL